MKLRYKLILAMLLVAAAPLGIAGYQALEHSRGAVAERIREMLAKTCRSEAEIIGRVVDNHLDSLKLVSSALDVDPESLSELEDELTRVYLLSDDFNAVALLDGQGDQIGPVVFVDDRESFSQEYAGHQEVNGEELESFLDHARGTIPHASKPSRSDVYVSRRKQTSMIVLAVPLRQPPGKRYRLVVELSLAPLQKRFEVLRVGRSGFAFLVDSGGRLVFHHDPGLAAQRKDMSALSILRGRLGTTSHAVADYMYPELGEMIGAFVPVPGARWALVVSQVKSEAFRPVHQLGIELVAWLLLGLALAGLFGLWLAARITRPVQELVRGARAIAGGNLGHKIRVSGSDEIGRLGQTFNYMGAELQKNQAQIEAQTEEIRRWNIELQDRVEERTRELKETQQQLVHAQKMAAMGELGAGVAHEVNNPLMGVLGCAQLLLMRHPEGDSDHEMLVDIEQEAQRIRKIVSQLLETAQRGETGMNRLDLRALIANVVDQAAGELKKKNIDLACDLPDDLPSVTGSFEQLASVLKELFANAANAMPRGGKISICAKGEEGQVVTVEVADTGTGIAPEHLDRIFEPFFTTKQNWQGKGLGLSTIYQIIQAHNGKISARNEPGGGAVFVISLPALRRGAHLR